MKHKDETPRERYLRREITHDQYYALLVDTYGLNYLKSLLPASQDEIREALQRDKYLNTIPIAKWDSGYNSFLATTRTKEQVNRGKFIRGTVCWSLGEFGCMLKAAARISVEGWPENFDAVKESVDESTKS